MNFNPIDTVLADIKKDIDKLTDDISKYKYDQADKIMNTVLDKINNIESESYEKRATLVILDYESFQILSASSHRGTIDIISNTIMGINYNVSTLSKEIDVR